MKRWTMTPKSWRLQHVFLFSPWVTLHTNKLSGVINSSNRWIALDWMKTSRGWRNSQTFTKSERANLWQRKAKTHTAITNELTTPVWGTQSDIVCSTCCPSSLILISYVSPLWFSRLPPQMRDKKYLQRLLGNPTEICISIIISIHYSLTETEQHEISLVYERFIKSRNDFKIQKLQPKYPSWIFEDTFWEEA